MISSNNTKSPLISVIMPVYNAGLYLSATINSVLNQSYRDFEIIAVDDGSTDNSLTILENYQRDYPDRIKVFVNPKNMGIGYSSNKAIKEAKGRFIAKMDADDLMFPDRLEKQVEFLQKNPEYVFVGGQVVEITEKGDFLGERKYPLANKEIYDMFFIYMSVLQGASMINRDKLPTDFSWYDESLKVAEDMDLFFRMFRYGKFANLPSLTLSYRRHPFSMSRRTPKETFALANKVRIKAVREYGYKPTIKAVLNFLAQNIAIDLLPESVIVPLYAKVRGIKLVDEDAKRKALRLNVMSLAVL